MSRRERQLAFTASVAVVAAAVAALSALEFSGGDEPAHPPLTVSPRTTPSAVVQSERRPPAVATGEVEDRGSLTATADPGAGPARRQAARHARRFIALFARYQAGRLDESTERTLRAIATPPLASYLLARPPRRTRRRYTRVRVERLELAGPEGGRIKAAALLAYGRRQRSLFEVALERTGTRWRVTDLYPSGD